MTEPETRVQEEFDADKFVLDLGDADPKFAPFLPKVVLGRAYTFQQVRDIAQAAYSAGRAAQNAELTRRVAELEKERDAYLETIRLSNEATRRERAEDAKANAEIQEMMGKYIDDLAKAERERDELRQRYRYCLWMHHGHMGLYGDDGEMQCAECVADFKRDPIEQLEQKVLVARAALRASESREENK